MSAPRPVVDPAAVLWSARPAEVAERPLLLLLHGIGASEGDLFQLSPSLPLGPVVASLRAPTPHGIGWSWYAIDGPGRPRSEGVDAAALAVLDWLDALDPAPAKVGLLGFSQGAAVSLQLLRHAPERFACAVQLSGYVQDGSLPGDSVLAELRPPVFWGRGTLEDVIPAEAIEATADWLPSHSALDARVYEGLAHAVSMPELADVSAFLRKHLG